jgi:fucose permease
MGLQPGWVLVYTALIMTILRFSAGPIIQRLNPIGLLSLSCVIAIIGLLTLSKAAGVVIFVGATIYAFGKSFFWPTMLGVVAERFPKGGALTLNAISGVGMLSVGIIGAAFLGNIQDKQIDRDLQAEHPAIHRQVVGPEKSSLFGDYRPLDQQKISNLKAEESTILQTAMASAKKTALRTVAIFPAIMLICYLILLIYFRQKGGYQVVKLE